MNPNQIVDLLTAAAVYDRRTIGEADVAAWSEAARRGGWTYEAALDAIHEHGATSTAWLTPAHITQACAKNRRPSDRSVDEALQLSSAPASAERRAELMAQIRELADRKAIS